MTQHGEHSGLPAAVDAVAAEAAAWLASYQSETLDEGAFESWRARDPAHAIAFARALSMWESFDEQARPCSAAELQQLTAAPPASPARRRFLHSASAVLAVGIVAAGSSATRAYAWTTVSTAVGENRKFRLPDGSMVALNTNSRLSWRFSHAERMLWIERGEISVLLRGGPEATVHSESQRISLSAGRFNVRLRNDAIDLLVLAGRAWVDGCAATPGLVVWAGDRFPSLLVLPGDAVARAATPAQIAGTIAWQHGEILFQDATLGSAVDEYNRFLSRKIVIVDRELASIPVGGRFTATDPTAFLHAVSTGLNVRVSPSATEYLLTR